MPEILALFQEVQFWSIKGVFVSLSSLEFSLKFWGSGGGGLALVGDSGGARKKT